MRFKKCSGVSHLFVLKDPNILISCSLNAQKLPSKHLLVLRKSSRHVLKMSSRHVLKTSSTRLQRNNFSSSKTKTSRKTKNCYAKDVFKTSWGHVLKKSWRQTKCLLWISVSSKSISVSDKSVSHISISEK